MHLLGGNTTSHGGQGHHGFINKLAQDVSGKEHQTTLRGSEFDRAPRSNSHNGSEGRSANPLLNKTMDDGTSIKDAYLNPAFYRDQPMLWLPRDQLGLSAEQVSKARSHGVSITDEDATIDEKAKIEIQRDTLPGQDFDP